MNSKPSIFLIISGRIEYKRDGRPNFQLANVGTQLFPGDSIKVPHGGKAKIQCAKGNIWPVPEGLSGLNNGCAPVIANNGNGFTRGFNDFGIPFVISPRSTLLLNDKPTLRWNAVSGASRYIVSVRDRRVGKGEIWTTEVSGTSVVYPGTPPLEPGVNYLAIVTADNGRSSKEDKEVDLRFRLIDKEESQRVLGNVEQIKLELSGEAAELAVVHLYATSDLRAEAIEMLEAIAAKGSETTAVYHLLGDLYWQVKLASLSENPYKKAVKLAEATEDIEAKAVARSKLAELYAARGLWSEAISWGTAAKLDYETLGDPQKVSELTQKLERWNER